ncbi:MAG: hypothetical protein Q8P67_26620, partial [archaeon]|nr:hypothetical protein [archaeon]
MAGLLLEHMGRLFNLPLKQPSDLLLLLSQSRLIPSLLLSHALPDALFRGLRLFPTHQDDFLFNHQLSLDALKSSSTQPGLRKLSRFSEAFSPSDLLTIQTQLSRHEDAGELLWELLLSSLLAPLSPDRCSQWISLKQADERIDRFSARSPRALLLRWVHAVCLHYAPSEPLPLDWTSDFADGRVFAIILHHINPYLGSPQSVRALSPSAAIHLVISRAHRLLGGLVPFLSAEELSLRDARPVLASVAVLFTHLLSISRPCFLDPPQQIAERLPLLLPLRENVRMMAEQRQIRRHIRAGDKEVVEQDPEPDPEPDPNQNQDPDLYLYQDQDQDQDPDQDQELEGRKRKAKHAGDTPVYHCCLLVKSMWTDRRRLYGRMSFERDRCIYTQAYTIEGSEKALRFSIHYDQIQRIELHKGRAVSFVLRNGECYHVSFFFRNAEVIALIGNAMVDVVPVVHQPAWLPPNLERRARNVTFSATNATLNSFSLAIRLLPQLKREPLWFDLPFECAAEFAAEQAFEEEQRSFEAANRQQIESFYHDALSGFSSLPAAAASPPGTLYVLFIREAWCEFPPDLLRALPDRPLRLRLRIEELAPNGMRVKQTLARYKTPANPIPRDHALHSWSFSKSHLVQVWRNKQLRIFYELEAEDQGVQREKSNICVCTCWFSLPPLLQQVQALRMKDFATNSPQMPNSLQPNVASLQCYFGPYELWPRDRFESTAPASAGGGSGIVASTSPSLPLTPPLTPPDSPSAASSPVVPSFEDISGTAQSSFQTIWQDLSAYRSEAEIFEAREKMRQPTTESRLKEKNQQALTLLYGGFYRLFLPFQNLDSITIPPRRSVELTAEQDYQEAIRFSATVDTIHSRLFAWPVCMGNNEIVASLDASPGQPPVAENPALQQDITRLNVEYQARQERTLRIDAALADLPLRTPELVSLLSRATSAHSPPSVPSLPRSTAWPVSRCVFFEPKTWRIFTLLFLSFLCTRIFFDVIAFFFGTLDSFLFLLTECYVHVGLFCEGLFPCFSMYI